MGSFPTWKIRWIREKMWKSQTKGKEKKRENKRKEKMENEKEMGRGANKKKGEFSG